jgi:hypothetical protein
MDPQICLNELTNAIANKDWDVAYDLAENLRNWIFNGGVIPTITKPDWMVILASVKRDCELNKFCP